MGSVVSKLSRSSVRVLGKITRSVLNNSNRSGVTRDRGPRRGSNNDIPTSRSLRTRLKVGTTSLGVVVGTGGVFSGVGSTSSGGASLVVTLGPRLSPRGHGGTSATVGVLHLFSTLPCLGRLFWATRFSHDRVRRTGHHIHRVRSQTSSCLRPSSRRIQCTRSGDSGSYLGHSGPPNGDLPRSSGARRVGERDSSSSLVLVVLVVLVSRNKTSSGLLLTLLCLLFWVRVRVFGGYWVGGV